MTKKERLYYAALTISDLLMINLISLLMSVTVILVPLCWRVNLQLWAGDRTTADVTLKMFLREIKRQFKSSLIFTSGLIFLSVVSSINFRYLQTVMEIKIFSVLVGIFSVVILTLVIYWLSIYRRAEFRFKDFAMIQKVTPKEIKETIIQLIMGLMVYMIGYLIPILFIMFYTLMIRQIRRISNLLTQEKKHERVVN